MNLKSTPLCLSTVSENLPSIASWICAVAPSRTVKSAGDAPTVSPLV